MSDNRVVGASKKLGLRKAEPVQTPESTALEPVVAPEPLPPMAAVLTRPTKPTWPGPAEPPSRPVLWAGAAAGVGAAVLLPIDRPGIGWFLTALIGVGGVFLVTRPKNPLSVAWALIALALLGTGALHASTWMFTLCVVAASAAGSLAVTDGKTLRGVVSGALAVPFAVLPSIPWVARGLRTIKPGRKDKTLGRTILISIGLLLVFVPLLAGADAAFASLLEKLVPDVEGASPFRWTFLFVVVGLGTIAACYVQVKPQAAEAEPKDRHTVSRREWAVPVGVLVSLFTVFVAVQLTVLFGGRAYMLRTANLTAAEYARGGFWQLLAVTVLTLVVIAATVRFAATATAADRLWLRVVLGALAGLTLVIVVSALTRMWSYQQAYGFTVLRLLVEAAEVWLGVVYVLVIAAGVKLRTSWLPRAVIATGIGTLLVLGALNPDKLIAEQNVARWQETNKIDVPYLAGLSVDAVPALAELPTELRTCLLVKMADGLALDDDWRSWNLSRQQARTVLEGARWQGGCNYDGTTRSVEWGR